MFFGDTKKAIHTMMAKRSAKGDMQMNPTAMKPEVNKTEDGQMSGLHAAAEDLIAAHRENPPSAHKIVEAMSNFINIHKATDADEFKGGSDPE